MSGRNLVSVVIPVHNGERHLSEAIESVLTQEGDLEVIVVDDGSTDRSGEIASLYPGVRRLSQPHRGAAAARNAGVAAARGDRLAFLDADDVWMRDKLSLQSAALTQDAELDGVLGHVEQFHSPELSEVFKATVRCPEGSQPAFHPGALLIRRAAFDRVGPFDETLRIGETIDWFARAAERHLKFMMPPEVVFRRRLHETNQGVKQTGGRGDYVRALKAMLDRRRASADESSPRPGGGAEPRS